MRRRSYPDAKSAAEACAARGLDILAGVLADAERATLALSGGASPRPMFEKLAAARFPWNRVHIFWVDERAVPPADPQSNYRLAAETFLIPAGVPQANIHRIHAELVPEAAARKYTEEIRAFFGLAAGELPRFDLVHRGMGADAHTASLFPGEPLIDDDEGISAAVYAASKSQWRITLLPGVLAAARNTVMLVTGADKAEAVRAVFHEPDEPKRYPAQIGARGPNVEWYLDAAAAQLL